MTEPFQPDEDQRALIVAAIADAEQAHRIGHPAPANLVARMTLETRKESPASRSGAGSKSSWNAGIALKKHARESLGPEQWRLVEYFGKVMDGSPHSGLYVSGLPTDAARTIVDDLMDGRSVAVHLMHRHKSGNYEASTLCRRSGRLIMLFDDRSEFA